MCSLSLTTEFSWDDKTDQMVVLHSVSRNITNFFMPIYLLLLSIVTLFRATQVLQKEPGNEQNGKIYDVAYEQIDPVLVPGMQLCPLAIILPLIIEFCEALTISGYEATSKTFVKSTRALVWEKRDRRSGKRFEKQLRSFQPIRGHSAYPFYFLSRNSCLEFGNTVVDYLVTLLVTY